ncbi:hypothetical protein PQX77_009917 [Marasmius sp. AFHP31]|nr:hypothetical protein PQX77_009917 [Marasmius sp. AFHP31]
MNTDSIERRLPDELWIQIFEMALEEDILLQPVLPTSGSEYAWYIDDSKKEKEWALRSPQEALALVQKENWDTKRALWMSCRRFNNLVSPYLYRCLTFDNPALIPRFNRSLNLTVNEDEKGKQKKEETILSRFTKRIFVQHAKLQNDTLVESLSLLLSHTSGLQSLIIDSHSSFSLFPAPSAFASLAQAITSTPIRKTLHTLHLHAVPYESLSHFILTLDSVRRNLVVAHVHISPPKGEEDVKVGSMGGAQIALDKLRQLSLSGRFGALMDQMICGAWDVPELKALSVDVGSGRVEMPDLVGFLCGGTFGTAGGESVGGISAGEGDNVWKGVGEKLWFLDIQASALQPELNIAKILDTCTQLRTFGFNADWRFPGPGNHLPGQNQQQEQGQAQITLPGAPHHNIHTVLLHGLSYAFNSGLNAQGGGGGFMAHFIRRSNDMNFAALAKEQFPSLKRIRVANERVLKELERNGGPSSGSDVAEAAAGTNANDGGGGWATVFSQATAVLNHSSSVNPYGAGGGMHRWERWYDRCAALGIRLEDCTGGTLGELPPPIGDEESGSEDEDEDEEWESDWASAEEGWEEAEEEEEEEVADALLSPSDDDSETSKPDAKDKGKGKEGAPSKRRNRPRLSIEETRPYVSRVRDMVKEMPPPPTPPDSPKKPSNSKFKFQTAGAGLSRPHVHELRRLVDECRVFEEQGEREERSFMRAREMATFMGATDEDDLFSD